MATAQEMVQFYVDAELKVLSGQSVRYGERMLTRADLEQIRAGRREWEAKVNAETRGGRTLYSVADFGGCT
jgi:hypothetical protein